MNISRSAPVPIPFRVHQETIRRGEIDNLKQTITDLRSRLQIAQQENARLQALYRDILMERK